MTRLRTIVHSLKFRLTLGAVAALALGMGIVAFLLIQETERDTLAAHRQRQISETVRVSQVVSRRIVELQRALHVTAVQLTPQIMADPARLAEFIRTKPVLNAVFSSVFLVSSDARLILLQREGMQTTPNTDLSARAYIRESLAQGHPTVSEALSSRVSGNPIIAFASPLIHDGKTYGVLAGSLNLSSRELLADLVDDDESGSLIAVADLNGTVLAHPDPKQVLTNISANPRFNEAFVAWVASGAAGEPSGMGLPQTSEVVSICGVAGTSWVVWRALPKEELLGPLRSARTHALKLVGALLALTSLATFALLAWVLRPLGQLSDRAQHLFDGSLEPAAGWPRARGEIGHLRDVLRQVGTERAQLQNLNEEMLKKLSSVMSAAPIGIAFTLNQRFELVSAELCRLLGRTEHELLGQHVSMIYANPEDFDKTVASLTPSFSKGDPYQGEWPVLGADGTVFRAQLRGSPVDDRQKRAGIIWTLSDVTAQVMSRELLEWSAGHDPLTGLANRQLLDKRLLEVFRHDNANEWSAVVVIDLDNFKPVNDLGGHAAGDAMLKAVATAIGSCVRTSDLVARTGGDEFALVLEGCPSTTAARIADDVRAAIGAIELQWQGRTLRIGASIGVAQLQPSMLSVDDWIGLADARCYEDKRAAKMSVKLQLPQARSPTTRDTAAAG
jgi:diguanylate cyclase (GGDEF)-like protein/PAS domain S-box-containing protein